MSKFKLANGWTKEDVMAQVKKYNNGRRSLSDVENCVYLSPDGNRCAVGCFIPDGHPALQSANVANVLFQEFPDLKLPFIDVFALVKFQNAHDKCRGNVHEAIQSFLDTQVE